ncbi:hypothetical protein BGZ65_000112, partial [Modicella reniformis]
MRPMVDTKGIPQPEPEAMALGSTPRTLTPTQPMGRPGMGMLPASAMSGVDMMVRHELSSPVPGGARDTPPISAQSPSPDGQQLNSQGKKRRKVKGKFGSDHGVPSELNTIGVNESPGSHIPSALSDVSEPQTPTRGRGRKPRSETEARQWNVLTPE